MNNKVLKITFDGNKYKLKKHSYRALFMFEDITKKPVMEIRTLKDQVLFLYCLFVSSNEDFPYDFEQFVDILEEDTSLFDEFREFVYEQNNEEVEDTKKKIQ